MMTADSLTHRAKLDEPWRRLPWLTPSALLLWALLLGGFDLLIQGSQRPPESIVRLQAQLIDLPPSAVPAGLQGSSEPPLAVVAPAAMPPQPQIEPKREAAPVPQPKKRKPVPPRVYDATGPHTAPPVEAAPAGAPPSTGEVPNAIGTSGGAPVGRGGSGGLGADTIGARAIYAPQPTIPDDLRENVFEAVAVAHFDVNSNGDASVSLTQATSNPRLNGLLLDTLKQWRFFPAVRNGVAIDSQFNVRIPIAVRER